MAWKPEVKVGGQWARNGLAFATEAEAFESARELMYRWMSVEDSRAVEVVGEPATHVFDPSATGVTCNKPLPRKDANP